MKGSLKPEPNIHGAVPSWGSLLLFDLFLIAVLILATRFTTFLHELIGHAFVAGGFGARVNGVQVSLFGGGRVHYHFGGDPGLIVRFLIAFGGIIVNILSGLLAFVIIRRLSKQPSWVLFLILFGMVSLLGAIAYCALGFYYNQGDPVAWAQGACCQGGWFWIPFLVISPFVSFFAVKAYSNLNEAWFPTKTYLGRVRIMILTLGTAACVYAGLYELTGEKSVALDAPSAAYERAREEVMKGKKEALFRRLRESHPELSETEVQRLVERTPIIIRPDEVPKRFPLKPVIAILYAGGALMALRRVKEGPSGSLVRIAPRTTIVAVALAVAVLGVLVWTGGWIYGPETGLP